MPSDLEIGSGLVEGRGGVATVLVRFGAGVEPAIPAPLVHINRDADTARDRSDMHVSVIDVPAIGAFRVSATGEGGHGPFKRDDRCRAIGPEGITIPPGSSAAFRGLERLRHWRIISLTEVLHWSTEFSLNNGAGVPVLFGELRNV
jgi:hypothetical protein